MAKLAISPSTVAVDNIQNLADLVVGQATSLKTTFDKSSADNKTYINDTLIPELNGDDGSKKIGHNSLNITADNVNEALEEVRQIAVDAQAGTIIDGSITDAKLSSTAGQIKQRVATLETDFSIAQSDINTLQSDVGTLETDLDIIRTAVSDTGTVNAIVVNTAGTFDLTRNGNILTIIPLFTNTSTTVNVAADGQTNKLVKKANDAGTMVALEIGDIKKNVPCQLVWDSVNDFFIFAPKWGSNIKSIQYVTTTMTTTFKTQAIASVDLANSIIVHLGNSNDTTGLTARDIESNINFINSTSVNLNRGASGGTLTVNFEVVEFKNVKSIQYVTQTMSGTLDQNTIASVNTSKTIVFSSHYNTTTSTDIRAFNFRFELFDATTVKYYQPLALAKSIKTFVCEFE